MGGGSILLANAKAGLRAFHDMRVAIEAMGIRRAGMARTLWIDVAMLGSVAPPIQMHGY